MIRCQQNKRFRHDPGGGGRPSPSLRATALDLAKQRASHFNVLRLAVGVASDASPDVAPGRGNWRAGMFRTTNPIENLNGLIAHYTRNVKRRRYGEVVLPWIGTALQEASGFSAVREV
jgi:hypothetical protein